MVKCGAVMDETTISQVAPEGMVTPPRRGGKRFLIPVVIVVLLLAGLFAGGKYINSRNEAIPQPSPMPTLEVTPTSIPTLTPAPTTKATPTKKPTPTKEASSSATSSKGLIVRVLNGSGISGRAASLADYLKGLGYEIGGTGNADSSDYDKSTITIKSGKSDLLSALKTDVATKYEVGTTSATLSSTETYDALVIIGKN